MKKLLAITLIVVGTFAVVGPASAIDLPGYPTWATDAFTGDGTR